MNVTGRAIRPDEIAKKKAAIFPVEVIEAFNVLIAKNFTNGRANVTQEDAIKAICSSLGISRVEVFKNHYLDIEEVFREAGWSVKYDKPGWDENYGAFFIFERART